MNIFVECLDARYELIHVSQYVSTLLRAIGSVTTGSYRGIKYPRLNHPAVTVPPAFASASS